MRIVKIEKKKQVKDENDGPVIFFLLELYLYKQKKTLPFFFLNLIVSLECMVLFRVVTLTLI